MLISPLFLTDGSFDWELLAMHVEAFIQLKQRPCADVANAHLSHVQHNRIHTCHRNAHTKKKKTAPINSYR